MPDGAAASAALVVDGVGLSSCARPGVSRSCCAAAAVPALGTIRRWDASRRPRWNPFPPSAEPLTPPNRRPGERGPDQHPDRLRAALGKLPGSFSTTMAARAAGINSHRALARLQDLERRGEVRRVGKRWSTESPPSDVAAAMDRLEARTSNVRIVRERARVG